MYRGTTPTLRFTLPQALDTTHIAALWVTLAQGGAPIVDRDLDNVTLDGHTVLLRLTQPETLLLAEGKVEIQLAVKTTDDLVYRSKIITTTAQRILRDEVI